MREFQGRPAFRYSKDGRWKVYSWIEADAAAREIAAGFLKRGLAKGDAVAIQSQTRVEWLLVDIAASLVGVVTVPIYPSSTPKECTFILADSQTRLVFVEDAAQAAKVEGIFAGAGPGSIVHWDAGGTTPGRTLDDLRAEGRAYLAQNPGCVDEASQAITPDTLFTIVYTSGTTGQPKGVELTHGNLVASCESAVRAFDLTPQDRQYLFLPLAHVLGREVAWAPIIVGAEVAFTTGLQRIKFDLTDIRPTFLAGVPRIFEKLHAAVLAGIQKGGSLKRAFVGWAFGVGDRYAARLRAKQPIDFRLRVAHAIADRLVLGKLRKKLGLDKCRFLISGGAALSGEIAAFFHSVGLVILEGYGLTETTAAAFVNRIKNFRFGTVGPAIDVVQHRLAPDGEILLKGPSVFARYHDNPQATADAIDADGWFHTGDIGVIEDGFLQIVDRKKDILITSKGKNVAPQKLENALKAHCHYVGQAVVFGDNRPHCVVLVTPSEPAARDFGGGDVAKAADSPALGRAIAQAIDEVNGALEAHERIKGHLIVHADFSEATGELTPSLKVKRAVVAERYGAAIDRVYEASSQNQKADPWTAPS